MFLEALVIVSLCLMVFGIILVLQHQSHQTQIKTMMQLMQDQTYHHIQEKRDLLNRASSKDWMTYAQVSQVNLTSGSEEDERPFYGMSDEDEMVRSGMDVSNSQGVGEVLAEVPSEESVLNDLRELGLVED